MNSTIEDVFQDNKYRLFVSYCNDNDIRTLSELSEYDFRIFKEVGGIGRGKLRSIIAHYNEYMVLRGYHEKTKDIEDDIKLEAGSTLVQYDLDIINESSSLIKLECFSGIFITKRHVNKLKRFGVHTAKDLFERNNSIPVQSDYVEDANNLYSIVQKPSIRILSEIYDHLKSEDNFKYFVYRIEGHTLQEIGDIAGVTRERIRQIAKQYEVRFGLLADRILQEVISKSGKSLISSDELMRLVGDKKILIALKHVLKNHKGVDYISFTDSYAYDLDVSKLYECLKEVKLDVVKDFINYYENIEVIESYLTKYDIDYIDALDCVDYFVMNGYRISGEYLIKNGKSYTLPTLEIINREYPTGIKLYDPDVLNLVRSSVKKMFPNIEVTESDRALTARMADNLVLSDRGMYIHSDRVVVDLLLLQEIVDYIHKMPDSTVMYHEIFEAFKGRLLLMTSISNRHYLHGVLKEYFPDEFDYERDVLHKKGAKHISISERVERFISSMERAVSVPEIKREFRGITDAIILNASMTNKKMMQWDYGFYNSIENLMFSVEELNSILSTLKSIMNDNQGYCSCYLLFEKVNAMDPEMLRRNKIESPLNLFYVTMHYWDSEYHFRRPHITDKSYDYSELSMVSIIRKNLINNGQFSYEDYILYGKGLGWSDATMYNAFREFSTEFFRLDLDSYIQSNMIELDVTVLEATNAYIRENMVNGFLPIVSLFDFANLPESEYEWNPFLVESIVLKYLEKYKVVYPSLTDRRYHRGIIVRSESEDVDYYSLIKRIVNESGESDLNIGRLEYVLTMNSLTFDVELCEKLLEGE